MQHRIVCANREEWLERRLDAGIGGSEAAACCGLSPFMTPIELWQIKTRRRKAKDLSENEAVSKGVRFEPALREIFMAMHPELTVEYHPFDIISSDELPFAFATLDAEFIDANGQSGIVEIKTATLQRKSDWYKWADGCIPNNYYIQVCHQMISTGYDRAFLLAALFSLSGDITIREYEFYRKDCEEDISWIIKQETNMWKCIQQDKLPPAILTI